MIEARTLPVDLGPTTEGRFAQVFEKGAQATAKDAAWLLGIDEDTLKEMTDAGDIRAVRRGRLRSWVECDLRRFLLEGPDAPPREREPKSPGAPARASKVVPFSQIRRTRR